MSFDIFRKPCENNIESIESYFQCGNFSSFQLVSSAISPARKYTDFTVQKSDSSNAQSMNFAGKVKECIPSKSAPLKDALL